MNTPKTGISCLRHASFALGLFALLALPGCAGYHLGGIKPSRMATVNTLSVPVFLNETFEPRIEVLVTNAIITQIQQDGTYTVRPSDQADAILKGTITEVKRYRARSVRGNVVAAREYVLELKLDYEIVDRATGEVLMESGTSGSTSFFVGDDVQQDERQGIPLAAADAAVEIVSKISEGW